MKASLIPSSRPVVAAIILAVLNFVSPVANGQNIDAEIYAEEGPYYAGLPVTITVRVAADRRGKPQVTVESKEPGLRYEQGGTSQRTSSFNGIVSVQFDFQFQVTSAKAGKYDVGPFRVKMGSKEIVLDEKQLTFEDVPDRDDMRIILKVPEGPFFPYQRVDIEVEWWYAGESNRPGITIYSPLFDLFSFEDEKPNRNSTIMPLRTKDGPIDVVAEQRTETYNGKRYVVFATRRTMIPDRIGDFELEPISAIVEEPKYRYRDSFFGRQKVQVGSTYGRSVGEPLTITVGGLPTTNQPESFAGAVGEGFSIDVTADRTVVRVGDPIRLDITLSGKGNIQGASLPALSADGGLDPEKFRLPDRDITGQMDRSGQKKTFEVQVRVDDDSIDELPAIAYSWFDPDAKEYRTTRSKPIALRVMPAQVVSAADVVSGQPVTESAGGAPNEGSGSEGVDNSQGRKPRFSLSGADLAIEPNPSILMLSNSGAFSSGVVQTGSYLGGFAMILLALFDRRRKAVDPESIENRKHMRQQVDLIAATRSLPKKEAAEQIAAALRSLTAKHPDVARSETQKCIGELEALAYRPSGSSGDRIDTDLFQKANDIASRFVKEAT